MKITKSQLKNIIKEEIQKVLYKEGDTSVVSEGVLAKIGEFLNVYWEGAEEHLAMGDPGGHIDRMYRASIQKPVMNEAGQRGDEIMDWANEIANQYDRLSTGRGTEWGPQMKVMKEAFETWRARAHDLQAIDDVLRGPGTGITTDRDWDDGVGHLKARMPEMVERLISGSPDLQQRAANIEPFEWFRGTSRQRPMDPAMSSRRARMYDERGAGAIER